MSDGDLAAEAMVVLDQWWDPSIDLIVDPEWGATGCQVRVRETSWYALGLLARAEPGDRERAIRTLDAVLAQQMDEPDTPWHCTWFRWPEEPAPVEGAMAFRDYDPNWREFIGCTLLQVLARWEGTCLPSSSRGSSTHSIWQSQERWRATWTRTTRTSR